MTEMENSDNYNEAARSCSRIYGIGEKRGTGEGRPRLRRAIVSVKLSNLLSYQGRTGEGGLRCHTRTAVTDHLRRTLYAKAK